jgi:hypothetical protein
VAGVEPPTGGLPIALKPETYDRHAAVVDYVEGLIRTRAPLPGNGRWPGLAPGAWGLLAAGTGITAGGGMTLGSGTVKLCDRTGTPTPENADISVSNAGAAITAGAGGKIVRLSWTYGEWAVSCGGA